MSKMSSLHAETAGDRADSAESDARWLRDVMRTSARSCQDVAEVLRVASPNSIIATDLIRRLDAVVLGLRHAAGWEDTR